MNKTPSKLKVSVDRPVALVYLLISVFFFLAVYDLYQGFILIGNPPSLASKRFVVFWIISIFPFLGWLYGLKLAANGSLPGILLSVVKRITDRTPLYVRIGLSVFLCFLTTVVFLYTPFGRYAFIYWLRLFTIFSCGVLSALLLFPRKIDFTWLLKASGMVVVATTIFVIGDWMTGVSDYPFSMTWSEGNRFWDYSIMFGMNRYINPSGQTVVPFLEAGRQFLWALPFIFPFIGIRGMRLCNVIIWVLPPLVLGWTAIFRSSTFKKEWIWQVGFGLWCFLFLSQGPIYSPLVICAIAVVIALRQKNLPLAIVLVAAASYYARISRWTWMYAPGLWAGMLSLIELQEPTFKNGRWKELIRPVILGLSGLAGAELLPYLITLISNGLIASEGSITVAVIDSFDFRQPMLWDRLFPNPTYSPGILLGFLWVGGPLLLFLIWLAVKRYWKPNWMQIAALVVIIGTFSVIGLIISVKIGGGSNLHNLDLLWLTLALLTAWVFRDWLSRGLPGLHEIKSLLAVFCLAMVFPTTSMIQYGEPYGMPSDYFADSSLEKLREEVMAASKEGEVLFMDQRQLLTFGYIKDVPLIAEYEKKLVMDQALSGNQAYFDAFYADLQKHRFSMIVSEPLRKAMADEDIRNFAEENNSWVYWVSRPLLKYYKPKVTYDEVGVQLLVPREN
ncbi:MAG: hypothetical protein GYA15_04615 [Leptolinea sp.]|jgi:hypothetical protein|nr:hypothetical protein [Leptolinea sp.]